MIPVHVRLGWSLDRNKVSGIWLGSACIIAAISALGLYYLGGEGARSTASLAHWLVGLVLIPALVIHAVRGRRGG